MTVKLPVELQAVVTLSEAASVQDVVAFLESRGLSAGLGDADFYTLTAEVRGLRGQEAVAARRQGHPTPADITKLGKDVFKEGFQITGPTAVIGLQSRSQHAKATGAWDPNSDSESPEGWRLTWYGYQSFSPVTDKDFPKAERAERFQQNQERAAAFVRAALEALPSEEAFLQRKETGAHCPVVPLAQVDYSLFAATPAAIAEEYADPDAFGAAWDDVQKLENGISVFTRGLDILDQDAFWRHAIEPQLALGRAAKPGRVSYPAPRLKPARQAQLADLPHHLEQVGYDAGAETLEFTAVVPEGAHLGVRDIYELAGLKRDGLPNGDPLQGVIVTFADEAMAKREARPLFDIGILVQYFGADGAFHKLDPK